MKLDFGNDLGHIPPLSPLNDVSDVSGDSSDSFQKSFIAPNDFPSMMKIETTECLSPPTKPLLTSDLLDSPSNSSNISSSSSQSIMHKRLLHDKLSSPDRKKYSSLSPFEAQKRNEARHLAAESNRRQTVAERIQKAAINSTRVKAREEREAARIAQAEHTPD